MEALISGHPQDTKKMSITILEVAADGECNNTEFVRELRKAKFCEGHHK